MNRSFLWHLYITFHTWLFGIPFLFFPNQVLPWLGFNTTKEPWIRVAGILFMVIGASAYSVYKHKITAMLLPSIHGRIVVVITLLALAIPSNRLFLYIIAGIILTGVIGSAHSYYTETDRRINYMSK